MRSVSIHSNEYTVMPSTRTHAPRGALVFDMRQLGRQAGSALTQTRTVPAPDGLRLELIGVPPGADVALEVRFEAVSEGGLAPGASIAPLAAAGPGHRHDAAVDPRWAALQQLSEQGNDNHQDRRASAIDLQEG